MVSQKGFFVQVVVVPCHSIATFKQLPPGGEMYRTHLHLLTIVLSNIIVFHHNLISSSSSLFCFGFSDIRTRYYKAFLTTRKFVPTTSGSISNKVAAAAATTTTTTIMTTIPDTMNAVVVRQHGGVEALSFETDFPVPKHDQLKKGQVLVKNDFAGLNFIDTYYRSGLYQQELPFIVGQEGAGKVVMIHIDDEEESVTSNKAHVKVGDVVAYSSLGSYCDYTVVDADKLVKIPDGISMEKALCCMVQGMTAHYLVTDALTGLAKPGDWMLIFSAGSGTCQWAAQMAKMLGYKVIGTTSKGKDTESTKAACDHLIVLDVVEGKTYADYDSVDIVGTVMEVTKGEGVKCILDGVGKNTADISIQCLARRGLWISFGNASGPVPPISLLRLAAKSAYVTRPKLNDYVATQEELQSRADQVFQWVSSGDIDVKVDCIFPLKDAQEGHSYLEAGKSKGKVLFKMGDH